MFLYNKTSLSSNWIQELQIACEQYEIELKKTASCGFGSLVEVYGAIEKVALATTKEVFVKSYLSNSKNIDLVEYTILYNVYSYKSLLLVSLLLRSFSSSFGFWCLLFTKSGDSAHIFKTIGNVYSAQIGITPTKLENTSRGLSVQNQQAMN